MSPSGEKLSGFPVPESVGYHSASMHVPRYVWHRISERAWDWHLGVQTRGVIDTRALALPAASQPYCPTPYAIFFEAMRHVPPEFLQGTFLDWGCGKGRTLILASRYFPFLQVLGVDLAGQMCDEARRNTRTLGNVTVLNSDASRFAIPCEVTVFFFFNPFVGEVLRQVTRNIRDWSADKDFRIVFCNHDHFDKVLDGDPWLKKTAQGVRAPNVSWAVYKPVHKPAST